MENKELYNPGSDEAINHGCLCPVLDNNHGKGFFVHPESKEPYFYIAGNCPLHGDIHGQN